MVTTVTPDSVTCWNHDLGKLIFLKCVRSLGKKIILLSWKTTKSDSPILECHICPAQCRLLFGGTVLKTALWLLMVYFYILWLGWRVVSLALIPHLLISMHSNLWPELNGIILLVYKHISSVRYGIGLDSFQIYDWQKRHGKYWSFFFSASTNDIQ